MSNDGQLPSDMELRRAIEARNVFRRQVGLPTVSPSHEMKRARQSQEWQDFERLMRSTLRYRVEQKLLGRIRRRVGDPTWQPTGMLSGGGWTFHAALIKQMRKLRDRVGG